MSGLSSQKSGSLVFLLAVLFVCVPKLGYAQSHIPFEESFNVPDEPSGYRTKEYRSQVPATLKGATVLSDEAAKKLWQDKAAIFIDVMPRVPKPPKLPKGMIWRDKKRENIPGSIWLVNVGYGILSKPATRYFKDNLQKVTEGDQSKALVFYCLNNCWMSWNAAKRALKWGYTDVSWYPRGTDGWAENGGALERSEPIPESNDKAIN